MTALLVTIDTEPDLPRRRQASPGTLHNIPALLRLQERIPDVRLTLLVTHSVVTDRESLRVLERLKRDFTCEIGAHLHPEETPPFVRGVPDDPSLMRLPFEARRETANVDLGDLRALPSSGLVSRRALEVEPGGPGSASRARLCGRLQRDAVRVVEDRARAGFHRAPSRTTPGRGRDALGGAGDDRAESG